jgi:hypothetical protein
MNAWRQALVLTLIVIAPFNLVNASEPLPDPRILPMRNLIRMAVQLDLTSMPDNSNVSYFLSCTGTLAYLKYGTTKAALAPGVQWRGESYAYRLTPADVIQDRLLIGAPRTVYTQEPFGVDTFAGGVSKPSFAKCKADVLSAAGIEKSSSSADDRFPNPKALYRALAMLTTSQAVNRSERAAALFATAWVNHGPLCITPDDGQQYCVRTKGAPVQSPPPSAAELLGTQDLSQNVKGAMHLIGLVSLALESPSDPSKSFRTWVDLATLDDAQFTISDPRKLDATRNLAKTVAYIERMIFETPPAQIDASPLQRPYPHPRAISRGE